MRSSMPMAIRIPVTSSGDEESSSRETERGRQPEWERDGLKTEKGAIQSQKNWLRSTQGGKKSIKRLLKTKLWGTKSWALINYHNTELTPLTTTFLTVRQGPKDDSLTEAAIAAQGASADLNFVLCRPAQVAQYDLVDITLHKMTGVLLRAALLSKEQTPVSSIKIIRLILHVPFLSCLNVLIVN